MRPQFHFTRVSPGFSLKSTPLGTSPAEIFAWLRFHLAGLARDSQRLVSECGDSSASFANTIVENVSLNPAQR